MAYRPQIGERKHRRMIGDAIARNEIALDKLRELKSSARNEATVAHIQAAMILLLENNNTLYAMLELVRNGGETCETD